MAEKVRHLGWNVLSSNSINVFVPLVAPAKNIGTLEAEQYSKRSADQPASKHRL
jgi:hypothetical protein